MNTSDSFNRKDSAREILLYAHRGSTVLAPENTLKAFQLALSYGADIMEVDVRLSREGEVIVIHDERVDRTCNAQGRVRDFTVTKLKKLDAGYNFKDLQGKPHRNTGNSLLLLTELFELLPETPINIDIKDNTTEAAKAVAKVIETSHRNSTVNVGSFHSNALARFRDYLPDVTTAATQSEVAHIYFKRSLYRPAQFEYLQIPMSYLGIPLATRDFIMHATARGIKTVYWTINDLKTMQLLVNRNASGFVTDRVDIAGPLLGKSSTDSGC